MVGAFALDNPWRRLPWVLFSSVVILALALYSFGRLLERPSRTIEEPEPIEAQLVELPPPPAPKVAHPEPPQPKPTPISGPRKASSPRESPIAPPPVFTPVAPPEPSTAEREPLPQSKPLAVSAIPTTAKGVPSAAANMGAHAILRPLPLIPDDLREDAFTAVAVARFHIATDGSATVELLRPTPNPRLNRLLLETLRKWQFSPAMKDGQPVPSIQEIRISLSVQ